MSSNKLQTDRKAGTCFPPPSNIIPTERQVMNTTFPPPNVNMSCYVRPASFYGAMAYFPVNLSAQQNPRVLLQGAVLNSIAHDTTHSLSSSDCLQVQPGFEPLVQKPNHRKTDSPDSESATERFLKIAKIHGLTVSLEKESDKNPDLKEKSVKELDQSKPNDSSGEGKKSDCDQKVSAEENQDGVPLLTEAVNSVQISVPNLIENIEPKSVRDKGAKFDLNAVLNSGSSEITPHSGSNSVSDMSKPDNCEVVPFKASRSEAPVQKKRPVFASRNVNLKLPLMPSLLGNSYKNTVETGAQNTVETGAQNTVETGAQNTVEAGVQTDPDLTTGPRYCEECKKEIVASDQQTLSQVLKKVTPEHKYKFTARQAALLLKDSPTLLEKPVVFQDELLKKLTAFCSRVKMDANRKEDELVCRFAVQLLVENSELASVKNGEEYFKRLKEEVTNMLELIDSVILDGYKKSNQNKLNNSNDAGRKLQIETKGPLITTCVSAPLITTTASVTKVTCIETTPASSFSVMTTSVSVSCTHADVSPFTLSPLPTSGSICLLDNSGDVPVNDTYSPNAKNAADSTHVIKSLTGLPKKPVLSSFTHQAEVNVTSSATGLLSSDVFRFTGIKSISQVGSNVTHVSDSHGQPSSIFTFSEQLIQKSSSAESSTSLPRKPCDSLVTDVINKLKNAEPPKRISQFESQKHEMDPIIASSTAINKGLQCADKPSPLIGAHNLIMNPPLAVDAFRKGTSSSVMSSPLRVSTLEQDSHSAFQKPVQNFSLLNQPTSSKLNSPSDVSPLRKPMDSAWQNVFQHSLQSAYNSAAKVMDSMRDSLPAANSAFSSATASGLDMGCAKNESDSSSIVSGCAEMSLKSLGSNSRILKKKPPLVLKKTSQKVTSEVPVASQPHEQKTERTDWWDVNSEYRYFQKPSDIAGFNSFQSSASLSSSRTQNRTDRPSKQIYLTPMQRKRNKILAEETNNSVGPCTWNESKFFSALSQNSDSHNSVSSAAFDSSLKPKKANFYEDNFMEWKKLRTDPVNKAFENFDDVFDTTPASLNSKSNFSENVTEWKKVRSDQVNKCYDNFDDLFDTTPASFHSKKSNFSEDNVTKWKKVRPEQTDKTFDNFSSSFLFAPDSAAESFCVSDPAQRMTSLQCLGSMSKNANRYSQFEMESISHEKNTTLPDNMSEERHCVVKCASIKSLDDIDVSDNGKSYTDVLRANLDVNINLGCSEKVLKDKLNKKAFEPSAVAGSYGLDDISLFDRTAKSSGDQTIPVSHSNEEFWYKVTGHKEQSLEEQLIDFRLQEKYSNLIKLIRGIHPFLTKREATEALELVFETNCGMKGMRQPQILSEVHSAVQELYPEKLKIQEEMNKKSATTKEVVTPETELECTVLSSDLGDKAAQTRAKPIKKARRMKRKDILDLHSKGPLTDTAESSSSLPVSADREGHLQVASGSQLGASDSVGPADDVMTDTGHLAVAGDNADEVKSLNPEVEQYSLASNGCSNPEFNTNRDRNYNCSYQPRAAYAEKSCIIQ